MWVKPAQDPSGKSLARLQVTWLIQKASRLPYLRRLGRLWVRELIRVDGDYLVAAARRSLVRIQRDTGEMQEVLQVQNGGRPKGLAVSPDGWVFSGEYWNNPQRQPLRIWGSGDAGQSWELLHSLPQGSSKHIHNLVWDEFRKGIWVVTGDGDGECAFFFTPDHFRTVTEVARGGQYLRACNLFCRPEGLYYGTDTERAPNYLMFFDTDSLQPQEIQALPGSCIYAARMANRYVITTSVEPSRINHYRSAVLWSSTDLHHWESILEIEKDWMPGEYFGFGSLLLPRIQGDCPVVIFTALAVKNFDFTTFVIDPAQLDGTSGNPTHDRP